MPTPALPSTRRDFLAYSGLAAGSLSFGSSARSPLPGRTAPWANAREPKRILILGGTGFLGPKTVEAALARGHHVTVFNRGRTEKRIPFDFKDVVHLYGNRDPLLPADDERGPDKQLLRPDAKPKGLEELAGKSWDVVIDNSGYYLRMVKASAELLAPQAKHYVFISSISAYAEPTPVGGDEDAPLAKLEDESVEDMGPNFAHYGGLKAACERAAQAAFPGRCTIVRPGYIVGPGDPTDRFSYWPVRIDKGGQVLAPGKPADGVQWIDVRDLARWLIVAVENATTGVFNAISQPAPWGDVLAACTRAASKPAELIWVDDQWLGANAKAPSDNFPIWLSSHGETAGFHSWKNARAVEAGMTFLPIDATVRGILDWFPSEIARRQRVTGELIEKAKAEGKPEPKLPDPALLKAGPSMARERELLDLWSKRSQ